MKQKFIALITLLLLAIYATITAQVTEGDWTYKADTIIKYNGTNASVTIPGTLGGNIITTIGQKAFNENATLTTVIIPRTVTLIDWKAFGECPLLTNVSFTGQRPAGKFLRNNWNGWQFYNCPSLTLQSVHNILAEFKGGLCGWFMGCTGVTGVLSIPKAITFIDNGSFNNTRITELRFEEYSECTEIRCNGYGAFSHNPLLAKVTFPKVLASIEETSFYACTALAYVEFTNATVPTIGEMAFSNIKADCKFVIPNEANINAFRTALLASGAPETITVVHKTGSGLSDLVSQGILVVGAKSEIHINMNTNKHKYAFVYNLAGTLVRVAELENKITTIGNLLSGIYIVRIGDNAEKVIVK